MPTILATTEQKSNTQAENYRGSRDFQPTNRNHPCPVCENTSGKCRVMASSDLILCMTHQEELPGWRFLGVDDKQGLWGKYFPDNPDYRPTYTPEARHQEPLTEWTAEQWDQHNRKILEQAPLGSTDRADILRRLDRAGLEPGYLNYFPAASLSSGYMVPCPNLQGQLLRGQIRYRGENIEGGRYRWQLPNEGIDGHINGEMPVGYWTPIYPLQRPVDALLTEGTGIKPFIAAQIVGVPAIGAAGGNHASSPKAVRAAIGDVQSVGIAVDAGAVHNHHVLSQYRKACAMLTGWGIEVKFLWWEQESKDGLDIDEGVNPSDIRWLSPEEFWALTPSTDGSFGDMARSVVSGPLGFLANAVDRVLNRSRKRQHREARAAAQRSPRQPDRVFAPGQRLAAIQEAQALGYTHVLDSSITGSGKSHFAGSLQPEEVAALRIIYLSDEHRNPTTATLQEWPDLESRHNGLRKEIQKDGSVRLRRAEGGTDLSVLPNCSRVPLIESLRSKGVGGADAAGTVCSGCPVREKCATSVGDGHGYIHLRQVLKRPRFRAHPDSLPLDYDLSKTVVLWDEMGKSFAANTVTIITLDDFSIVAEYLSTHGHDAMASELRIIRQVVQTLAKERDVHGVGFDKFIEAFEGYQFGGLDPLRVDEALDPDLEFLNPTAAHGVDVRDLPPALRKQMAGDGLADAEAIPPQFYGNLLRVLRGMMPGGSCRINKQGKFELSVPNPHHRNIANGAQLTIALDATTTKEDYALRVGTTPDKVWEIREEHAPMANLTIKQITDIGYCGQQRGEDKQRRINAAIAAIQANGPAPVLDFKSQKTDGAWFVDTRGVNTWQRETSLILVGTPTANLGAVYSEWIALIGRYEPMNSPSFQAYLQGKTDAELAQGFGRLRANRRPDEKLTLWLISSHDIRPLQQELGFVLEEMQGADLTIDAAPKEARHLHRMWLCAQKLIESGKFCSQKIVAQLMGITEGRVSQIAKAYYGGWKKFVKAVKVLLFGEQMAEALDPEQSEIAQTLADMLTASLEDTESESAQLIAELLDGYGILYHHAVQRLTDQTRAYLAARLILMT